MATDVFLTAVFDAVEDGWVQARVAELPGVITSAPTLEEAKEQLVDAVREYLLSLREEPAEPLAATSHQQPLHVVIDAA